MPTRLLVVFVALAVLACTDRSHGGLVVEPPTPPADESARADVPPADRSGAQPTLVPGPSSTWGNLEGTPMTDEYAEGPYGQVPGSAPRTVDTDETTAQAKTEPQTATTGAMAKLELSSHRSAVEITVLTSEPEPMRPLVVEFHERIEADDGSANALLDCLGSGGSTPGGKVEIGYYTERDGRIGHIRSRDCGYADEAVCACMTACVEEWRLPRNIDPVQVWIRVEISPGRLPAGEENPRAGHLW